MAMQNYTYTFLNAKLYDSQGFGNANSNNQTIEASDDNDFITKIFKLLYCDPPNLSPYDSILGTKAGHEYLSRYKNSSFFLIVFKSSQNEAVRGLRISRKLTYTARIDGTEIQ